jgi:hypothetical protein
MAFIIHAQGTTQAALGPATLSSGVAQLLSAGYGIPFRMVNGDETVELSGRFIPDGEAEHPLTAALELVGAPAGATRVLLTRADGVWVDIAV